jgi:predicted RND superfamily exporter protein
MVAAMQRFWSWLAVTLGRRAGVVGLIGLIITLVLGFGITRLEFATGQDSYLNKTDQVYQDSVAYQGLFGGQAMLGLVTMDDGHTVDELFDADGIAQWESLHDDLAGLTIDGTVNGEPAYASVVTPLIALEYTDSLIQVGSGGDPTRGLAGQILLRALAEAEPGTEAELRQEDSATTLARVSEIPVDERTFSNSEWIEFLLYDNTGDVRRSLLIAFDDPTHASIIVRLPGNLSIDDEGRLANIAKDRIDALSFPDATVTATGVPILLDDINEYLRGGMLMLGGIAVAIMVLILILLFDVRWRLLPMAVILVGIVWAFGLAGYLGIPLTIVTIAGLPVMLGVGIDYAIQMHARVEEEVILDRSPHPIQETARNLGPALLVVTFDAVFAFLALRFAKVPMIRDFGLLLAVGIAVICLNSIVMPLGILGMREHRSPTKGRDFREGALGRLTVWLGSLPQSFAVPLAVASVAIFVGGIAVEGELVLQTDPVSWVNQESDTIQDIHTLEDEVGTAAELGVFVQSDDVFTDENMAFMHRLRTDMLAEFGGEDAPRQLLTATSQEEILADIAYLEGANDLVPTGNEARMGWILAPPDLRRALVSRDGEAANLVFRIGPGGIDDLAIVVDTVREYLTDEATAPPAGTTATPSGIAAIGVGLLENLESNRVFLTYVAMAFVFAFLAVRLRSIVRSLLSLVPVAIAVGAASLVAWIFSLELSPMTAVGGPLVIAACTEFTSLILLRFVEERARGIEPQEAVDVVAARTGRAFIVSGLTAIVGVAVLSFSSLPLLRDFGRIVAMNVAVALLSALVVLPPLLVWAERRGWVSRGLIKPQLPFIETPPPVSAESGA